MPDEVPMVTSCPLCLSADEVQSMLTIEIDRAFGGSRTAIMICRKCATAVLEAVGKADPPLLSTLIYDSTPRAGAPAEPPGSQDIEEIFGDPPADETQAESAQLHEGEEPDDGEATD